MRIHNMGVSWRNWGSSGSSLSFSWEKQWVFVRTEKSRAEQEARAYVASLSLLRSAVLPQTGITGKLGAIEFLLQVKHVIVSPVHLMHADGQLVALGFAGLSHSKLDLHFVRAR